MKLPPNLGVGIFSRGLELFSEGLELASGEKGVKNPVNLSMFTLIFTLIINNTFELLILRHHFISNHLKSELKPDFTQHQRAYKHIDLTGRIDSDALHRTFYWSV